MRKKRSNCSQATLSYRSPLIVVPGLVSFARAPLRSVACLASLLSLFTFALFTACTKDDTAATVELRVVSDLVPYYEAANITAVLYDGNVTSEDRDGRSTTERAIVRGTPLLRGVAFEDRDTLRT